MRLRRDIPRCWSGKDSKAPDGIAAEGWRIVRAGGFVLFAGVRWQHDSLKPHAGDTVFCWGQDYWQQECKMSTQPGADGIICTATPYHSPEEIEAERVERERRIEAEQREMEADGY